MICSQAWGEGLGPLSPAEHLRGSFREGVSIEGPNPAQMAMGGAQGPEAPSLCSTLGLPHWQQLEVSPFTGSWLTWTDCLQLSASAPTTGLGTGEKSLPPGGSDLGTGGLSSLRLSLRQGTAATIYHKRHAMASNDPTPTEGLWAKPSQCLASGPLPWLNLKGLPLPGPVGKHSLGPGPCRGSPG